MLGVVELGEEVRRPSDGVRLARTGGVLHEVLGAGPVGEHRRLQLACDLELVEAREDHALDLLLLVALRDAVTAEDLEPALTPPDLLPEVGCALAAGGIHGVALTAVAVALVERQELSLGPLQVRHHLHLAVAHGEVHECAIGEGEQRFGPLALRVRVPVEPILVDGVGDALREVGLQLDRRNRHAVQEEHEVDAVLVVERVADLAHDAQPVLLVAREDLRVDRERGLELGDLELLLEAEELDAMAEHVERAALVDLVAKATEQRLTSARAVVPGQELPRLRLRRLHPIDHVGREESAVALELRGVASFVEPAVRG